MAFAKLFFLDIGVYMFGLYGEISVGTPGMSPGGRTI